MTTPASASDTALRERPTEVYWPNHRQGRPAPRAVSLHPKRQRSGRNDHGGRHTRLVLWSDSTELDGRLRSRRDTARRQQPECGACDKCIRGGAIAKPVPEPAAVVLMCLGAIAFMVWSPAHSLTGIFGICSFR